MKGQQDGKETEKENVHGDTIDNIKDKYIGKWVCTSNTTIFI